MLLDRKRGLVVLVFLVFLANYVETSTELPSASRPPTSAADYNGAYAAQQFEPEFINFDSTTRLRAGKCTLTL